MPNPCQLPILSLLNLISKAILTFTLTGKLGKENIKKTTKYTDRWLQLLLLTIAFALKPSD